jgi:hypothetical protein
MLSFTDTDPYNYVSTGDGTNPVTASVTLDGTGSPAEVASDQVDVFLVATTNSYTGITVSPVNEADTGINWQVSLDGGSTWEESVSPADMDATAGDQVIPVSFRYLATNDGSLPSGEYTAAALRVTATENS